jgi:hypothetical protein
MCRSLPPPPLLEVNMNLMQPGCPFYIAARIRLKLALPDCSVVNAMLTLTRGLLDSSLGSSMSLVPGEASSWVQASPAYIKIKTVKLHF